MRIQVNAVNTHEKILEAVPAGTFAGAFGYPNGAAKGLNLERVTPAGVLDAGHAPLYVDSYRAARPPSICSPRWWDGQAGAKGRAAALTGARVIVLASQQNSRRFYELEAGLREAKGSAPPYRDLYTITFSQPEEGQVLRGRLCFGTALGCLEADPYRGLACQVLGPAPAAVAKINYYRYRLTLRTPEAGKCTGFGLYFAPAACPGPANRGISAFLQGVFNRYD